MPELLVLDCSHYQPVLDIQAFKLAGVVGVIHQATQYLRKPPADEYYQQHRAQCLAAGLLWGAYLYFDPRIDGVVQADFFLDTARPDSNTLLAVDLEEPGITLVEIEKCLNRIYDRIGEWPWTYTAKYVIDRIGGHRSSALAKTRLWVAGSGPVVPMPWIKWDLWQYGYKNFGRETFDANRFVGTLDDLKSIWRGNVTMPLKDARVISLNELETHSGPGLAFPVNGVATVGRTYSINSSNAKEDADNAGVIMYELEPEHWLNGKYLQFADNTNPTPQPDPTPAPVPQDPVTRWVKGVAPSVLNVRISPSTSAKIIKQLPEGTQVQIVPPAVPASPHYVALFSVAGVSFSGYVSNDYLTATKPNPQ